MSELLRKYIASKVEISDEEFDIIKTFFTEKKIRKRQYFLQEGDICKNVAFVIDGLLRQYVVDEKGHEHIMQFAIENWWIGDRESMLNNTPSAYNIDAVEDSVLLLINREKLDELELEVPAFNQLMRMIIEQSAFAGQKRLIQALAYTAEDKYNDFLKSYPKIAQRIPQHMIASYLGVTAETLSRIRARAAKK